jgi:hypothetical protein
MPRSKRNKFIAWNGVGLPLFGAVFSAATSSICAYTMYLFSLIAKRDVAIIVVVFVVFGFVYGAYLGWRKLFKLRQDSGFSVNDR